MPRKKEYIAAVDQEIKILYDESIELAYNSGTVGRSRYKALVRRDKALCLIGKKFVAQQERIEQLERQLWTSAEIAWPGLSETKGSR